MKLSLSLTALVSLSVAHACVMDICALNGGCTTVVSNDYNWHDLPGGNPPYYHNLRYAKITGGKVMLDQYFGNVIAYSPGDILTIQNIPPLNTVGSYACLEI
ncbi:hypothetical protein GQ53DRAFT_847781 [Thozetella sp. PMI_491]|nr:hypothetical protein GQ53DRAFT_847781 [Thozetella sp. PMI_491]